MKLLNKAQVDALFQREAVLFGSQNGIPEFRATMLFGKAAVEHACNLGCRNGYGIGGYTIMYLSYQGFLAAASYYNTQQLQEVEDITWTARKGYREATEEARHG